MGCVRRDACEGCTCGKRANGKRRISLTWSGLASEAFSGSEDCGSKGEADGGGDGDSDGGYIDGAGGGGDGAGESQEQPHSLPILRLHGHEFSSPSFLHFVLHVSSSKPRLWLSGMAWQLVHSLVRGEDQLRRYENAASLARSFVDDQPSLKWCPAPDCSLAVRGKPGVFSVKCTGEHRFCFQCMQDDHQPASCENLQKWTIKCRDDSETYNWLVANTKACPKCQTSIEKNGGCNHMTVRRRRRPIMRRPVGCLAASAALSPL